MAHGAAVVLRRAAERARATARGRPWVPAHRRFWAAARLLARGDRVSRGRPVRCLCAVADLRDRDLLVRVRARPRDRRPHPRGHGGAADGRHSGVHGTDAKFRSAYPCHGVLGSGAAVLLAGRDRRAAAVMVPAWRRGCAPPAHQRRRPDPAGDAGSFHGAERQRARGTASDRSMDRLGRTCCRAGRPSLLAQGRGRSRWRRRLRGCASREWPARIRRLGCGSWARSSSLTPGLPFWWCWRAAGRERTPIRRRPSRARRSFLPPSPS